MCAAETDAVPPSHWTYRAPTGDLSQGDVLKKTDEIKSLLEEVHPHYLKDDYTHFLVLTQTCDLVRRDKGACKSRYITLAAVRPLELAIKRALEKYQESPFEQVANVCSAKHRGRVGDFLVKLFNNNEHDYFYLHEDVALGLSPSSCAFLQLSIAIRARDHYEKCIKARVASMSEIFAAKLGWLVGNLYSRVGTDDWTPEHQKPSEFKKRVEETLEAACKWIDDEQLKGAVKKATPELVAKGEEAALAHLESFQQPSRRERLLAAMEKALLDSDGGDPARARKIVAVIIIGAPTAKAPPTLLITCCPSPAVDPTAGKTPWLPAPAATIAKPTAPPARLR
jgi:hypothetical protein